MPVDGDFLTEYLIGGRRVDNALSVEVQEKANEEGVLSVDYGNTFKNLEETLDLDNTFLANVSDSSKDLIVPGYQRHYSWSLENHKEFWRDIENYSDILNHLLREADEGNIDIGRIELENRIDESFFGPIYIAESEQYIEGMEDETEDVLEVIDGQQRLSTVFILLNEIRRRLKRISESVDEDTDEDFFREVDYFRWGMLCNPLFGGVHTEGDPDHVRLKLSEYDNPYFKILFADDVNKILEVLSDVEIVDSSPWKQMRNILSDIGFEEDEIDIEFDDLMFETADDEENLEDLLNRNLYFASKGSHKALFDANNEYVDLIDRLLDEKLGLEEDQYKKRTICLINIAIIVFLSLRVIECKFDERTSESMKIEVFTSLNETGKPLDTKSKIRARIVSRFKLKSEEVNKYSDIIKLFGDSSKSVEEYFVNYILATEKNKTYSKGDIKNNLLEFFSPQINTIGDYNSRIATGDEDYDKQFISDLKDHAKKYKIIDEAEEIPPEHIADNDIRNECNNILEDLKETDQWKPFVLRMYIDLVGDSAIVTENFFLFILRQAENIMIRSSFSNTAATSIDKTFIGSCKEYNNKAIPEFENINGIKEYIEEAEERPGWADVSEFSDEKRRIMQSHLIKHSDWDDISGTDIARNMSGTTWSNNKRILKLLARRNLAGRITRNRAVSRAEIIDFSTTELEHILPESPVINQDDNRSPDSIERPLNWYNDFFKLYTEEGQSAWPTIAERYSEILDNGDLGDRQKKTLLNRAQDIIDDVGNNILLETGLNNAVRNAQFSVKSLAYYLIAKHDLNVFGEFIADPDNINFSLDELICNAECLGLKLGEGEAAVLLYEVINAFEEVEVGNVNEITSTIDIDDESKLNPNSFADHYSTPVDMFAEFGLTENDYSTLYQKWEGYEYDDAHQSLVLESEEGDDIHASAGEPMDGMIDSILRNIANTFDYTAIEENPDTPCKVEVDTIDSHEGTDSENRYIVDIVNKKWNWERALDRKVHIVQELLDVLETSTIPTEFDNLDEKFHRDLVKSSYRY
ncbi:DUF262 domain-containing protein [Haladaptatus sp. YSMS36]|uniref:DUF262 domain-containing protein n=1 Tax=Haladaptatus sp. YSMS36 TaxID=3033384 RepID=UPI0023E8AEFE|nr:DUF262 domain-containing protein [Haladaptatus sp. YSMS36]